MPARLAKPAAAVLNNGKFLNSGSGDSVIGGAVSGVPSEIAANRFNFCRPGDRIIVSCEDAYALSDVNNVGTLYGGLYQYVTTKSGATATATRGKAAFWDTAAADSAFQVTPDESGSQGVAPFAGVYINTLTAGYSWWICQAGKVLARMIAAFTGIPTNGCAVYLGAQGAGEPGVFDVLDGGGNPTYSEVSHMLQRYVGWAEGLPVAAGIGVAINIPFARNYRW